MAKKKTTKKTAASKAPKGEERDLDQLKELVGRVAKLFHGESDGDPEKIGQMVKERLATTPELFERWKKGEAVPVPFMEDRLQKLLIANKDTQPGQQVKRRSDPDKDEERHLDEVMQLAELTALPAWRALVKWIASKEASIKNEFETCKQSEVKSLQGELKGLRSFRERVLKPAEELEAISIFTPLYLLKIDEDALTVTVSKR